MSYEKVLGFRVQGSEVQIIWHGAWGRGLGVKGLSISDFGFRILD
jgi:hypothetical protein